MTPGEVRSSALTRRDWMAAVAIGLAAFALRLVLLYHSVDRTWPHSTLFERDASVWAKWASAQGRAQEFEFDLPFRAPLVAFSLHVLGAHVSPFLAAKVVWCAVFALTASVTFLVLARWFSRRAGWIAATWITVSFASLTLATSLNGEALYACAVPVLVGATLAWVERPTWARSLPLGAVHGLALLVRPEHALVLAISST